MGGSGQDSVLLHKVWMDGVKLAVPAASTGSALVRGSIIPPAEASVQEEGAPALQHPGQRTCQ